MSVQDNLISWCQTTPNKHVGAGQYHICTIFVVQKHFVVLEGEYLYIELRKENQLGEKTYIGRCSKNIFSLSIEINRDLPDREWLWCILRAHEFELASDSISGKTKIGPTNCSILEVEAELVGVASIYHQNLKHRNSIYLSSQQQYSCMHAA